MVAANRSDFDKLTKSYKFLFNTCHQIFQKEADFDRKTFYN